MISYVDTSRYGPDDITILTPYVGQLLLIKKEVSKFMMLRVGERDAEELADLEVHCTSNDESQRLSCKNMGICTPFC